MNKPSISFLETINRNSYDLNKSGQAGVFGVQLHAKNTQTTNY
jgi:hypothetical protein